MATDINEIQAIIWEYFKNLRSCKLQNEEEIDEFLDLYDPPKLNQEVIKNFTTSVKSDEIETVMKNLPTKKRSDPDGFTA
jgi:hypothetical protein